MGIDNELRERLARVETSLEFLCAKTKEIHTDVKAQSSKVNTCETEISGLKRNWKWVAGIFGTIQALIALWFGFFK